MSNLIPGGAPDDIAPVLPPNQRIVQEAIYILRTMMLSEEVADNTRMAAASLLMKNLGALENEQERAKVVDLANRLSSATRGKRSTQPTQPGQPAQPPADTSTG